MVSHLRAILRGLKLRNWEAGSRLTLLITTAEKPLLLLLLRSVVQLAVTRDSTERMRAQNKLRKSEEQLRTFAEDLEKQVRNHSQELQQSNAEALQRAEQCRELSNRFQQTQDEERRHIARELHRVRSGRPLI